MTNIDNSLPDIILDNNWLQKFIEKPIHRNQSANLSWYDAPILNTQNSEYGKFITENKLSIDERLLLALSIMPHLDAHYFNDFTESKMKSLSLRWNQHLKIFLPTGLTFIYIMTGNGLAGKLKYMPLFTESNVLGRLGVIGIEPHEKGEPSLSGRLYISEKWLELFITEKEAAPDSIKYWTLNSSQP
jgi:hypothetical protein